MKTYFHFLQDVGKLALNDAESLVTKRLRIADMKVKIALIEAEILKETEDLEITVMTHWSESEIADAQAMFAAYKLAKWNEKKEIIK